MALREPTDFLARAAVSGRFDPVALLREVSDEEIAATAGALASECEEELFDGRYLWTLKAGARRAALARMLSTDAIRATLRDAPEPKHGDLFALHLHRVLQGRWGPARVVAKGDVDEALHMALQFARDVPALTPHADRMAAALERTRERIARRERDDTLSIVLPRGRKLIGRAGERTRLKRFARGGTADPRPLVVSGTGGVGKSALLVGTIRELERARSKPVVLLLDFDRPALSGGDPFEIVREVTRQLSIEGLDGLEPQELQLAQRTLHDVRRRLSVMRELRPEFPREPSGPPVLSRIAPEEQYAMLLTLAFQPLAEGLPEPLRRRPIVLVMDTLEVIAMIGESATSRIVDLEAALRDRAGLSGLRTVMSGRALDKALGPHQDRLAPRADWISLQGFRPREGAAFLRSRDRNARFPDLTSRVRASRALKGHPLALLVLELYAREREPEAVSAMLEDIAADGGLTAELAQRFLYSRILDRIADPDVRRLAHPGLVLRQVSSHLIRLVLARPCGLGAVDVARSRDLLSRLRRQYWLVDEAGDDMVRHRSDLRRLMIAGMFAPARLEDGPADELRKRELLERATSVSRAAADFYTTRPADDDPSLGGWTAMGAEARNVERLYHLALAGDTPPDMTPAEAGALKRGLGEDLDGLPDAWRAAVKAMTADFARLTDAERATLSGPLRDAAENARIDTLIRQESYDDTRRSLSQERERKFAGSSHGFGTGRSVATPYLDLDSSDDETPDGGASADGMADAELLDKEVVVAFSAADLPAAAERADRLLRMFVARHPYWTEFPSVRFSPNLFLTSGAWLGALSLAAGGQSIGVSREPFAMGTRTYGELGAVLMTHVMARDAGFLRRPSPALRQLARELAKRRVGTGTIEDTRSFATAARVIPAFWSGLEQFELTTNNLCLMSAGFKEIAAGRGPLCDGRSGFEVRVGPFSLDMVLVESPRLRDFEACFERIGAIAVTRTSPNPDMAAFLGLLRGQTPELHRPAAQILRDVDRRVVVDLVSSLAEGEARWPRDLVFQASASPPGGLVYSDRDALTVVVTADRCGVLRTLLERLVGHDARAVDLLSVHDVVTARLFTPDIPSGRRRTERIRK